MEIGRCQHAASHGGGYDQVEPMGMIRVKEIGKTFKIDRWYYYNRPIEINRKRQIKAKEDFSDFRMHRVNEMHLRFHRCRISHGINLSFTLTRSPIRFETVSVSR